MNEQKRQFRIGDLAKNLAVERFVIRFWEKEFGMKPQRSKGGQRFYEYKDMEMFARIKTLLYDEGFTIAGAKKMLHYPEDSMKIVGSQKTTMVTNSLPEASLQQLKEIRQQLLELKKKI